MATHTKAGRLHNKSYGIYIPYDVHETRDRQVTRTDLIATPTSSPGRGFTAATVFIDGNAGGMRLVESSGPRLSVLAMPFAELARLKERLSPWDYIVYVIDDPSPTSNQKTYIGHGDGERKFGDRLGNTIGANTQIYAVIAAGDKLDKVTAPYVEGRLIGICTDLNIPLANSGRPFGRGLGIMDDLEQLVGHAETLLLMTGCRRDGSHAIETHPIFAIGFRRRVTDRDEMVAMTEAEQSLVPQNGLAYRLDCRDLHAVGYAWNDRFYVIAKSAYAQHTRSDLSYDHQRRRDLLEAEQWVGPVTGTLGKFAEGRLPLPQHGVRRQAAVRRTYRRGQLACGRNDGGGGDLRGAGMNLRALATSTRPLHEAFVDRARRGAGFSRLPRPILDEDDELVSDDGGNSTPPVRSCSPEVATVAVLLGRAFENSRDVLAGMLDPDAVIVIQVPHPDLVKPVRRFLRLLLASDAPLIDGDDLDNRSHVTRSGNSVVVFMEQTKSKSSLEGDDEAVAIAMRFRCATIGIVTALGRLPKTLVRLAEHRVVVPPIDATVVADVIEAVTAARPAVDATMASRVGINDLAIAVRDDIGGERSLERLRRLVEPELTYDYRGSPNFPAWARRRRTVWRWSVPCGPISQECVPGVNVRTACWCPALLAPARPR